MKVELLLKWTLVIVLVVRTAHSAAAPSNPNAETVNDETQQQQVSYTDHDMSVGTRSKRSGEVLSSIKKAVGNSIKHKLGVIARGSASASSHFSKSSSGHPHGPTEYAHHYYDPYYDYDFAHEHDHKYNFWSLKKSILNTLLQAVKAIKGGVIALKGEILKGSGYLVSQKAKFLAAKGEAIVNLGKNIANSATSVHYADHHDDDDDIITHNAVHHYGSSHFHPHDFSAPSAPGPEFDLPQHYPVIHGEPPFANHAEEGIIILKKMPIHHTKHEHKDAVPVFKPIKPLDPGIGEILGKFFKASTSLKPGEPLPFPNGHEEHNPKHTASSHTKESQYLTSSSSHKDSLHNIVETSDDHKVVNIIKTNDKPEIENWASFEKIPSYLELPISNPIVASEVMHFESSHDLGHSTSAKPPLEPFGGSYISNGKDELYIGGPSGSASSNLITETLDPRAVKPSASNTFGGIIESTLKQPITYLPTEAKLENKLPILQQALFIPFAQNIYQKQRGISQGALQKLPYGKKSLHMNFNYNPTVAKYAHGLPMIMPNANIIKSIGFELSPNGLKKL